MVIRGGDQAAGLGTGGWDGQVENRVMWIARVPEGEVSRGLVKCYCDVTAEKHPKGESSMSFLLSLGTEYLHTAEGEESPRPYQSSLARPQSGLWLLGCYAMLQVKHVKPPLTQVTLWAVTAPAQNSFPRLSSPSSTSVLFSYCISVTNLDKLSII